MTSYADFIYLGLEDDISRTLVCIESKQPYYTTLILVDKTVEVWNIKGLYAIRFQGYLDYEIRVLGE